MAVDFQSAGLARLVWQIRQDGCLVHTTLCHVAIGGPFAAGDGQEPALVDMDDVVPRERRLIRASVGFYEWAYSCKNTQDVRSRRFLFEIKPGGFEDKVDF